MGKYAGDFKYLREGIEKLPKNLKKFKLDLEDNYLEDEDLKKLDMWKWMLIIYLYKINNIINLVNAYYTILYWNIFLM